MPPPACLAVTSAAVAESGVRNGDGIASITKRAGILMDHRPQGFRPLPGPTVTGALCLDAELANGKLVSLRLDTQNDQWVTPRPEQKR